MSCTTIWFTFRWCDSLPTFPGRGKKLHGEYGDFIQRQQSCVSGNLNSEFSINVL